MHYVPCWLAALWLGLAGIGPGLAAAGPASTAPLRFAPMPMEDRETLIRQFAPLLPYLARAPGQSAELVLLQSNAEIVTAFVEGTVDLVQLGPLPYLWLAARSSLAEPLVRFREPDGSDFYRCALAAFMGDEVTLAALRGQPIGLTQPLSTCGYLSVNGLLRQQAGFDLEQTRYRYLGGHDTVAQAVIGGEVRAGGLKETLARRYAGLGLRVLARTDPLPGFALIANRATLSPELIARLRQSLLALPDTVWRDWGEPIRYGMDPASDQDYDVVRALGVPDIPGVTPPP